MNRQDDHFRYLFEQFISKKASREELNELFELLKQPGMEETSQEILDIYFAGPVSGKELDRNYWTGRLQEIINTAQGAPVESGKSPGRSILRTGYWWAAAAAILFAILGGYLYFSDNKTKEPVNVAQKITPADIKPPESNRATITLASGNKILLDSVGTGTLASQGMIQLIKKADGQIAYELTGQKTVSSAPALNTLYNPRGSRVISLTLSDGSQVWLNAESSITYPTAFAGNERKVVLTGEAYFEVVHNAKRPFRVKTNRQLIEDIGTAFNVNAYSDDEETKTTLIEGSVSVNKTIIKPGEQEISTEVRMKTAKADIESTMAWKNGQFILKGTDLAQLLRQVSRWYDVDIDNKNNHSTIKFGGSIARTVNLSTVMEALRIKGVNCRLEGKTLVVE